MKDLYHLVTVADGRKDSAAIMDVLQKIHDGKLRNDLKLLNFIREVPVSFNATLENVADDRVEVSIHQNQAVMMKHDKSTLIRSSHFPNEYGVHAYVALANPTKCFAILTRFAYAQIRADRRTAVRVQIHHAMPGTFVGPSGTISGNMLDISVGGVSLAVQGKIEGEVDETGSFSCVLPTGKLQLPARLLKVVTTEEECKAIFVIEPDSKMETVISQFIFNEQIDIIKELKDRFV